MSFEIPKINLASAYRLWRVLWQANHYRLQNKCIISASEVNLLTAFFQKETNGIKTLSGMFETHLGLGYKLWDGYASGTQHLKSINMTQKPTRGLKIWSTWYMGGPSKCCHLLFFYHILITSSFHLLPYKKKTSLNNSVLTGKDHSGRIL